MVSTMILFILHGVIGALLHAIVHSKHPNDLKQYENIKIYIIGAISGYIYYLMYTSYNIPDSFLSIVFGYFSRDIIETFFEKLRGKLYKVLE